jgi:hypothetical protein
MQGKATSALFPNTDFGIGLERDELNPNRKGIPKRAGK